MPDADGATSVRSVVLRNTAKSATITAPPATNQGSDDGREATVPTGRPHCVQKHAPAPSFASQWGHDAAASGVPQLEQNFPLDSVLHFGHFILARTIHRRHAFRPRLARLLAEPVCCGVHTGNARDRGTAPAQPEER
jgi:hypothetical protein